MDPLAQIEAMPDDAAPKRLFAKIIGHIEKTTGHAASAETRSGVAYNIYTIDMMRAAVQTADIATILAELTVLSALHLTALGRIEEMRAVVAPLTDDERAALDRLPADFTISEKGN